MVKEESGEGLVDERGFEPPAFLVVPRTQQSPSHVKSKTRSGRQIPPLRGPTRHNSARKRKSGRSGRNDKFEVVYGWWTRGDSNRRLPRCKRCRKTHKMRCCNQLRLLVPDSHGQLGQVRSRVLVGAVRGANSEGRWRARSRTLLASAGLLGLLPQRLRRTRCAQAFPRSN